MAHNIYAALNRATKEAKKFSDLIDWTMNILDSSDSDEPNLRATAEDCREKLALANTHLLDKRQDLLSEAIELENYAEAMAVQNRNLQTIIDQIYGR